MRELRRNPPERDVRIAKTPSRGTGCRGRNPLYLNPVQINPQAKPEPMINHIGPSFAVDRMLTEKRPSHPTWAEAQTSPPANSQARKRLVASWSAEGPRSSSFRGALRKPPRRSTGEGEGSRPRKKLRWEPIKGRRRPRVGSVPKRFPRRLPDARPTHRSPTERSVPRAGKGSCSPTPRAARPVGSVPIWG